MTTVSARANPRLSLNQFAIYMSASPLKRRSILQNGKYPRGGLISARYREASDAVAASIASGSDPAPILGALAELNQPASSDFERKRREDSEAVLNAALLSVNGAPVGSCLVTAGDREAPPLVEGELAISVRPELLLREEPGGPLVGAGKLYISRTLPLDDDTAFVIAWLVHEWVERVGGVPKRRSCWALDVVGSGVWAAPRAVKTRRRHFLAACAEICASWDAVEPPGGY